MQYLVIHPTSHGEKRLRALTRANTAASLCSQETHVAIVCMGLQMLLGGLSSVLACNLLLLWKERARKKA